MNRRRAGTAAICLLLGVVVILSAPYLVWQPTVGTPNYWENHTGGLLGIVLGAMFGGGLVIVGFGFGFDIIAERLQTIDVRTAGALAVVGGLLDSEPIGGMLVETVGGRGPVYFGVQAGALVLLVVGVAGVIARYPPSDHRGEYAAGVLAGGFSLLAGTELLSWGLTTVEPQTGALSYPTLGTTSVATLALAIGSVLLGVSLRDRDDSPRWLGPLLAAAGVLVVPLEALAFLQYGAGIGLYGLTWVVVGAHLLAARPSAAERFD